MIVELYNSKEVSKLLNFALNNDSNPCKIGRNLNHPIYKLAVPKKVKNLLFEIAIQKCNHLTNLISRKSLINEKTFQLASQKRSLFWKYQDE